MNTDYTFTFEELGYTKYALDSEEVLKEFPDKAEARCLACGNNWTYERGNGLMCPWCAADFHTVYFSRNKKRAEFDGKRVGAR